MTIAAIMTISITVIINDIYNMATLMLKPSHYMIIIFKAIAAIRSITGITVIMAITAIIAIAAIMAVHTFTVILIIKAMINISHSAK